MSEGGGGGVGAGGIITGIFDSIDSGIQTWLDFGLAEEQSNAQPCVQLQKGGPKLEKLRKAVGKGRAAAEVLSLSGRQAVERALQRHGVPDSRYVGVQSFPAVIADHIPGVSTSEIRRRLPEGRPSGTRSGPDTVRNRGAKLAEGVYVWAGSGHPDYLYHLAQGTLRGDRLRAWYDTWADRVRTDAAHPAEPQWRIDLAALTGDVTGDWRIWVPGLDPAPDSPLGIAMEIVADGEIYLNELIARCAQEQARGQDRLDEQLDLAEADIERRRQLGLAVAAAAAVVGVGLTSR